MVWALPSGLSFSFDLRLLRVLLRFELLHDRTLAVPVFFASQSVIDLCKGNVRLNELRVLLHQRLQSAKCPVHVSGGEVSRPDLIERARILRTNQQGTV